MSLATSAARRAVPALATLSLVLAAASPAAAQTSSSPAAEARVSGVVRGMRGAPLRGASVHIRTPPHAVGTDAKGRYTLRVPAQAPPTDTVRVRVRAIGHLPADTLLRLRAGDEVVWHVALRLDPGIEEMSRRVVQERAARDSAGGLDSVAAGLVVTDTAAAFTYERFGVELLRAAIDSSTADSSRVLSPSSAGQALGVAWRAAVDSSAYVIGPALHAGALDATVLAARTRPFRESVAARRDVTLRMATALWVDTSETLQRGFADWVRDHYRAEARPVPLYSPEALRAINGWADSATAGRIPVVRTAPYDSSVKVVLADAVYLKGAWLEPFDSARTTDRPFATARGERIEVPTMEHTGDLAYRRAAGYQALRVPYRAGLTAMYLVLPDSGVSPRAVLDSLAVTGWPVPDARTERRPVRLRLPRVHVEQATDLKPVLSGMGLDILFDDRRADFGALLVPSPKRPPPCPPISAGPRPDGCTLVRISDARQHVFLDVNEEGTEAAAVTTVGFAVVVTSAPPPPHDFSLDRPFLFALRDERTGTMLFVGYIADPRG